MENHCKHCGKLLATGAKSLCLKCYQTRVSWQGSKAIIVCKGCGELKKQNGKGLCQNCYNKAYMKEYHADYERTRRVEKREHVNALDRARNKKPERQAQRQAYQQKYYAEHKAELLKYQSDYRRSDPVRRDNYKKRSIARRRGLSDTLTVKQWNEILETHNHACYYCGKTGVKLEREHKIPAINGGGYTAENIVPACGPCNRRKRTMSEDEFREYVKKYPR
jgi:5-methylcytosine-specific restriction endonuclease McrA